MAFNYTKAVWYQTAGLKPTEKLVLLALADRANQSGECFPSYERIAKDTGLSRSTVITTIRELVRKEFVAIIGKQRRANRYKILI